MGDSIGQLIVVLAIFAGVLFVTFMVTKWISGYQRSVNAGSNIKLVETAHLATGKYIQIVRLGDKYVALGVCKDSITKLCEIDESAIVFEDKRGQGTASFKSILSGFNMSFQDPDDKSDERKSETETLDNEKA